MLRRIGLLTGLLFLSGACYATGSFEPGLVYQTAVSSITTVPVLVSTSTIGAGPGATQVDKYPLSNRVSMEIQNVDTSANLWCSSNSTAPVSNLSRKILPGNTWVLSIKDKLNDPINGPAMHVYCIGDGTQSSTATVTQSY